MELTPSKLFTGKWQICYEHYLRSLYARSQSEVTVYEYDKALARFFCKPGKNPNQYSRADVENYLNLPTTGQRGRGTPPMPRTRNYRLMIVRSFYHYARNYSVEFRKGTRYILRVPPPTDGMKLSRFADADRDMSEEEVRAFFHAIPRNTLRGLRDHALFLCLFLSSRRRTEIALLKWCDLERVVFSDSGGMREGWIYRWRGKGHSSRDDMEEMPAPAMAALKEYLVASGRWGKMRPEDPLFHSEDAHLPGKGIARETVNKRFRVYANLANLDPVLCVHSLRYAAAYEYYIESGKDLVAVQRRLRHQDIKTTQRYVTRRRHGQQSDAVALRIYDRFANL